MTMTPTDASERERLIAALHTAGIVSIDDQYRAADMLRADAEKIRALEAKAEAWCKLYRRAFNEADGLTNYVDNRPGLRCAECALEAIETDARALAATQSPRSEAGEGKK